MPPLAHAYTHTHTRITRLGTRLGTLLTHKNTQDVHNYTITRNALMHVTHNALVRDTCNVFWQLLV